MTGKDMIVGLSFIEERLIDDMEEEPPKKRQLSRRWRNVGKSLATAAGLILITGATVMVQQIVVREETFEATPSEEVAASHGSSIKPDALQENESGVSLAGGGVADGQEKEVYCEEGMQECDKDDGVNSGKLYLNEIQDVKFMAYRESERDMILWDAEAVSQYYGRNLDPQYVPEDLEASSNSGKASVVLDGTGKIVYDVVLYEYYERGAGLTESAVNPGEERGFTVAVSKIYEEPAYHVGLMLQNEVQASEIAGMKVILGYGEMPFDSLSEGIMETEARCRIYTAQFEKDGIYYQIIATEMELTEVIAVIESIP